MSDLAAIRSQVFLLLRETSGTDTNFTDAQLDSFINQGIKLMAPIIDLPRKRHDGVQVAVGTGNYAVADDFIKLKSAYFGSENVTNDIEPLTFITQDVFKRMYPGWLNNNSNAYGRPRYIMLWDEDTFFIYPRPSAAESVSGKKIHYFYVFEPADLSSDSASPELPLPYHNIIKFYACHLAYLNLGNQNAAASMLKSFEKHHDQIKASATAEADENLSFKWGIGSDAKYSGGGYLLG